MFYWVLSMSIVATLTGGIVWGIRAVKCLPRRAAVMLWVIPFARMALPFGINSPFGVMTLLSRVTTNTVTVFQPAEQVALSMTNCIMAADTYFPITYKVNRLETVFTVAAAVWLVGTAGLLVWIAVVYRAARREADTATHLKDNIYVSDGCSSPYVYGILRPKIVLPASLDGNDREWVLLHEQTHIRRGDNVWRLLAVMLTAAHWFNPFSWLFLKRCLADMETACDEQVLAQSGEDRAKEYARLLLRFAQPKPNLSSAFGGAPVKERIGHILSYKTLTRLSVVVSAVLVIVSAFVLLTNAG